MNDAPLAYPEALRVILDHASALCQVNLRTERVPLLSAQDRVLAEEIVADRDQPPFRRSTRDGYACHAAPLTAGRVLTVTAQLRAGQPQITEAIQPTQAIEIMTGAPVPSGADAVVMFEHVTVTETETGDRTIMLLPGRSLSPGENIVPRGSEAHAGDMILPAGTRLTPAALAAAAACGAAEVEVYARPRVAVLATGDELVEIDQAPSSHQIRNSNSCSIAAQVRAAGGDPRCCAIARDDCGDLQAKIRSATEGADLLVLSGGVSTGKYDLVESVLAHLGAEFLFQGVLIQPGRPAVFGRLPRPDGAPDPTYFFALPGNPVSTLVTFLLFAAPMLRALAGMTEILPRFAQATLTQGFPTRPGLTRFLPARLESSWDSVRVTPLPWQGSGDLAAASKSNCFLVVPPDRDRLLSETTVSVLLPV